MRVVGTIGVQGHCATDLAARYIASDQAAAYIAESAVGLTRFEICDVGPLEEEEVGSGAGPVKSWSAAGMYCPAI